MTGDRVIVGFDGSKSSTTLAFVIKDINTDALRQIYGAEHFDTKGDYTMELDRKALDARMAQAADSRRVFVLDRDALSALPTDTKVRICRAHDNDNGPILQRERNGAWQWYEKGGVSYGNVTKNGFADWFFPAEVLNPELMGEFAPTFAEGDIVVVEQGALKGVRGKVVTRQYPETLVALQVIDHPKPGVDEIYLAAASLRPFDPARDFRVGDIVEGYGDRGVVTDLSPATGGNIKARFDKCGADLGARRENLTLVGHKQVATASLPEPKFSAGDIVVYSADNKIWHGRRCRVVSVNASRNPDDPSLLIESLDGDWPQTYLPARYFRPFDPKTDFRLGDTVRFKANLRSLGTGVITTFHRANGVRDTRVKVGSAHYRVDFVDLELAAPEAEPIREEFNLTGAYVADQAGLDALPVGTVIERTEGGYNPMVKMEMGPLGVPSAWRYLWDRGLSTTPASPNLHLGARYVVKHVPGEFPETKGA